MATADDLRAAALALAGTSEAAHVDRRAFKVARIYATLAPDGLTANLKLVPEDQAFVCMLAPEAFAPVAGGWGRMGWTTATLAALSRADLERALDMAWRGAAQRRGARKR